MSKEIQVAIRWLHPETSRDLALPAYETAGSAGLDVAAAVQTEVIIEPGDIVLIPTGFAVAIPPKYEIQVRPRSGLAVKHGVTLINSPGTIDSDYRGEVKIGLINHGRAPFTVRRGARIAQLILAPVARLRWQEAATLDQTARGTGGFGHTGME